MDVSPVSAVLIFRDHPERAEQTLQVLLPHAALFREVIIMDDGSTDLTPDTIDSLIAAFNPENVQFYRNAEPAGKGACLNQLITALTAPFFWAPAGLLDFDPEAFLRVRAGLGRAGGMAGTTPALAAVDPASIAPVLEKGTLPPDAAFFFNPGAIAPRDAFANPFIDEAVAAEWAARIVLSKPGQPLSDEAFFVADTPAGLRISDFTVRQIAWSLFSATGAPAFAALTGLQGGAPAAEPAPSTRNVADRIRALLDQGETESAAWLMELLDADEPLRAELEPLFFPPDAPEPAPDEEDHAAQASGNADAPEPDPAGELAESMGFEELHHPDDDGSLAPAVEAAEAGFDEGGEPEPDLTTPAPAADVWVLKPIDRSPQAQISLFDAPEAEAEAPEADPAPEPVAAPAWKPAVSVVIPTTIDGARLLESCLLSIGKFESPDRVELIVVDNASLDDTAEYLGQLRDDGFFNIRVITNAVNRGVAASINQGIDAARADVVCFLHNDAELCSPVFDDLADALARNPEFGAISVPPISYSAAPPAYDSEYLLHETSAPASVCLAFRKTDGIRFDEQFAPAWFEDTDFFMQLIRAGFVLGRLDNRAVFHDPGTSTRELGFFAHSAEFLGNRQRFEQKWDRVPQLPEHLSEASAINRILAISDLINPRFPEPHLLEEVKNLLLPEVRTELTNSYWERENLFGFIRVMALADQQQLLRSLEEKAASFLFYPELILQLVEYYFQRSIYSRCENYLNMLDDPGYQVPAALHRIAIYLEDHKIAEAVELCTWLSENAPVNADYFAVAARVNEACGEREQADTFRLWARQMHPLKYNDGRHLI